MANVNKSAGGAHVSDSTGNSGNSAALRGGICLSQSSSFGTGRTLRVRGYEDFPSDLMEEERHLASPLLFIVAVGFGTDELGRFENCNFHIQPAPLRFASPLAPEVHGLDDGIVRELLDEEPANV